MVGSGYPGTIFGPRFANLQKAILRIESATRFDDVDHELGYAYRGFNYVIRNELEEFTVIIYDDEPGRATVSRQTMMSTHICLSMLVEFLQSALAVSAVFLYKGETGCYAEIDLASLRFKK